MADLCVSCAALTDAGRDPEKQVNEDAFGITAIAGSLLGVVCDGMGGHVGGRLASHTAVDTIQRVLLASNPTQPTRLRLHQAIVEASEAVHRIGGDTAMHERPGATCVAVWLHQSTLEVAHVGDSRAYRLRAGRLEALTRDHSVIEAWIMAGQVTREQAHQHPDAHRITRALGIQPTVDVELRTTEQLLPGDKFLLCSDGLTDLVTEDELARIVGGTGPLDQRAAEAISLANARGGHDNVTVLLLEVTEQNVTAIAQNPSITTVVLSTPQVAAACTEQLEARVDPLDRTVALDAVAQTVVMGSPALPRAPVSPTFDPARTLPFAQLDALPATRPVRSGSDSTLNQPSSPPRVGPSPRQLLTLVGVTLLLVGFAILFGLFRR